MHRRTIVALLSNVLHFAQAAPQSGWQSWSPAAPQYKYVLTFSVDGMHGSDVEKYIAARPNSTIASLLSTGYEYTDCYTSAPSDSFPGTMAQYTGGTPKTTGIWYDDTWDWTYWPPSSGCQGPPGAEVLYDESIDYNSSLLFSGGIDPANLPETLVNGVCTPIYPHERLLVNTVFNVLTDAGLQGAYVDKHPAYEIVNGPSGHGLTAGYFPEQAATKTTVNATIAYDQLHVNAWLDFIDGIVPVNGTGSLSGMPALIGGNFQSFSVAEKTIEYLTNLSLSPAELQALDFVDASLGKIVAKLSGKGYLEDSLIIVASKHGQAPINPALWNEVDPDLLFNSTGIPTAFITTDDIGLVWLNHTSDIPAAAANLQAKASEVKIQELIYGQALVTEGFASAPYNAATASPRIPHIIVRPDLGTCYTTSKSKTAEHGGLSDDDRHVACFVSNPKLQRTQYTGRTNTTQVASTILKALGLNPQNLQAVAAEGTLPLPGF